MNLRELYEVVDCKKNFVCLCVLFSSFFVVVGRGVIKQRKYSNLKSCIKLSKGC